MNIIKNIWNWQLVINKPIKKAAWIVIALYTWNYFGRWVDYKIFSDIIYWEQQKASAGVDDGDGEPGTFKD
jgi:hypothetical protein